MSRSMRMETSCSSVSKPWVYGQRWRHTVRATYGGDDRFLPSAAGVGDHVAVEVAKVHPTVEVALSGTDPVFGEQMTATVTLHPAPGAGPTGTVQLFDANASPRTPLGSAPIAGGTATITFAPAQAHTLVLASYGGDRNFTTAETPSPFTSLDAAPASATLALSGPTTLAAILSTFQMGFRTLAIQKRSSEVWNVLGQVKTEFGKFGDVLAKKATAA